MIGPLGRLGAAATLGQHCPQMTLLEAVLEISCTCTAQSCKLDYFIYSRMRTFFQVACLVRSVEKPDLIALSDVLCYFIVLYY